MYEASFVQDAKMPRDAGLVDVDPIDDVVYRVPTAPKHLNNVAAGGVGESLKDVEMHARTYV